MFEDALYEVLQGRRYDRLTGRAVDVPRIIAETIGDLVLRLLERLAINTGDGDGYNLDVIIIIFSVVTGVLIAVAGLMFLISFLKRRKSNVHDLAEIFEELQQKRYTVADLLSLSQSYESTSRRIAVRFRYIAALLALHEQQVIHIRPSSTNALILRELAAAAPDFREPFDYTADCFHRAWFGHKLVSDDVYARFVDSVKLLISGKR